MRPQSDPPLSTQGPPAPVILLTATLRWPIAARLAMAFADLGCRVEALCPDAHPVLHTRAASRTHRHSVLRPLESLRAAIEAAAPDLVIPCDDDAALALHRLYERSGAGARPLQALIARSLGTPGACSLACARGALLATAAEVGVRVAPTAIVANATELEAWIAAHRLPAVVKIDGTWGGQGVAVVRHAEEARLAFARMSQPPPLANTLARALLDRDASLLAAAWRARPRTVTLQDFIEGEPANRAFACWQGRVLAGISVQALQTRHATGPATVVRIIDNAEMADAAVRLAQRLGLSGLWGLDFVLDGHSGAAHLIEMNPRATPICHLALGAGHDLPAALRAQLTGMPARAPVAAIEPAVIALFPGEWQRDPASPYLHSAFHDVPWREAELVREGTERPWAERGLIARAWRRWRPRTGRALPKPDIATSAPAAGDTTPSILTLD